MKTIDYRFNLDLHAEGAQTIKNVQRGDNYVKLIVTFSEEGKPYPLSGIATVKFAALKADGNYIYDNTQIVNNSVEFVLTGQCTAAAGLMVCQFKLIDGSGHIKASPTFALNICENAYDEQPIVESSDEFNALTLTIADLEQTIADLEQKLANHEFDGESAYELAVDAGYVGTVEQWLASLKGDKGDPGDIEDIDPDELVQKIHGKINPQYTGPSTYGYKGQYGISSENKPVVNLSGAVGTWTELAKGSDLSGKVDKTQKIAGIALSGDISKDDLVDNIHSKINPANVVSGQTNGYLGQYGSTADKKPMFYTGMSEWAELAKASDIPDVSGKADKATTLMGYGITDAYTKSEVNGLFNDLNTYKANKSETYTKTQVDNLIAAIATLSFEVVQALPTTDIKTNVIYLLPKQTPATGNIYEEWAYINNNWELLGTTDIDISGKADKATTIAGYGITDAYTKAETNVLVNDLNTAKANKSEVYTKTQVDTALSGKANKKTNKPEVATVEQQGQWVIDITDSSFQDLEIAQMFTAEIGEVVYTYQKTGASTYILLTDLAHTSDIPDISGKMDLAPTVMPSDIGNLASGQLFLVTGGVAIKTNSGYIELERTSKKVTSIDASSDNFQYPSAKAVYDYVNGALGNIETALSEV